ncbi:hypothetical protein GA8_06940 [Geobacillus sp. A8]|nr:hypothetical protein GA8_06940 [Geobacillus sp. A8]
MAEQYVRTLLDGGQIRLELRLHALANEPREQVSLPS